MPQRVTLRTWFKGLMFRIVRSVIRYSVSFKLVLYFIEKLLILLCLNRHLCWIDLYVKGLNSLQFSVRGGN